MNDLKALREDIDKIDEQLLKLLARRQSKVHEIAKVKAGQGMTAHQPSRHEAVVQDRQVRGKVYELNPAMVNLIWQAIMTEAIRIQKEILNDKTK